MEAQYWMWLQAGLGFAAQNTADLFAAYPGGAKEIAADLPALPLRGLVTKKQAARLGASRPEEFAERCEALAVQGITPLCYNDYGYPALLRHIHNPPPLLYAKGNAALLNGRLCIAMVGARQPSAYGAAAMKALAGGAAKAGAVVVSGLAAGLDAEAHKAALAADGDTVACIAFGHDYCYPKANRHLMEVLERCGAVVSEYPPGVKPERAFFLQRNRLIAALSHALVVAEARAHSGTMSTVAFAQDYGRDVYAVPGDIFSELSGGTNAMLREGAGVASGARDILLPYAEQFALRMEEPEEPQAAEAGPGVPAKPPAVEAGANSALFAEGRREVVQSLGEQAQTIYALLTETPQALGVLCEESGLAPGAVMAALTELELAGLSAQQAGRQFVRL